MIVSPAVTDRELARVVLHAVDASVGEQDLDARPCWRPATPTSSVPPFVLGTAVCACRLTFVKLPLISASGTVGDTTNTVIDAFGFRTSIAVAASSVPSNVSLPVPSPPLRSSSTRMTRFARPNCALSVLPNSRRADFFGQRERVALRRVTGVHDRERQHLRSSRPASRPTQPVISSTVRSTMLSTRNDVSRAGAGAGCHVARRRAFDQRLR